MLAHFEYENIPNDIVFFLMSEIVSQTQHALYGKEITLIMSVISFLQS